MFLEQKYEFVVDFYNAIARKRVRSHHSCTACRITGCHFLPNDRSHEIESYRFTETGYLCTDWNHLISSVIDRTCKLISDIDTQATSLMQNPMAFLPSQIQVVDVLFIGVIKSNLAIIAVILQLPVGR